MCYKILKICSSSYLCLEVGDNRQSHIQYVSEVREPSVLKKLPKNAEKRRKSVLNYETTKKSLAQEVRPKSDISERRSKHPFNPYFVCNTSNCATVRPVSGHLTPKMNIAFFIRNLMLNIFLFNNFLEKKCIFRENSKKLFWGRI